MVPEDRLQACRGFRYGNRKEKQLADGKARCSYVREDGKLEYVQPVAGSPYKIEREMTEVYGVGAFLLAATEMLDL